MNLIHIDTREFIIGIGGSSAKITELADMILNRDSFSETITSLINPRCIQMLTLIRRSGDYYIDILMSCYGNSFVIPFHINFNSYLLTDLKLRSKALAVEKASDEKTYKIEEKIYDIYKKYIYNVHRLFLDKFRKALVRGEQNIILAKLFEESIVECFQGNG